MTSGTAPAMTCAPRDSPEVAVPSEPGLPRHLMTVVELALVTWVVYLYGIEAPALPRVMLLTVVGFTISVLIPQRSRLPFFALLSLAGTVAVFGVVDGAWLVTCGLALIGLSHAPVPFKARVGLVLVAAAALATLRAGVVPSPWSMSVWPILGSMFMFRLILYMLAMKSGKTEGGLWGALSYFFMLPNLAFPLFPVVDYQTFRRTYFNEAASEIYQRGTLWITRGVVQLLLYRVVYHSVLNDPVDVVGLGDLVQFMVGTFLLYLRVSGSFHLIIGLLHVFGFGLPATHKLYYLSDSFTDVWRRINIYWTDFMMKVVFYPLYFKVKRLGPSKALVIATVAVFVTTWLLHSYQWFWITGGFPLALQDAIFWALLGALVVRGALKDLRAVRKPRAAAMSWSWQRGLRTATTFTAFCFLWSLWSADSLIGWVLMLGAAVQVDAKGLGLLALVLSTIFVLGGRDWRSPGGAASEGLARVFRPRGRTLAGLAVMLILAQPGVRRRAPTTLALGLDAMHQTGLNAEDADLQHRGYYEQLDVRSRFTDEVNRFALRPADWDGPAETGIIRERPDFLLRDLFPSQSVVWNGNILSTNSWGMRDKEYTLEKPRGTLRIALLGPSHVMGNGVADGESFEALVEERLNRSTPVAGFDKVEVLNFGVDGYSLTQQLAILEDRVFSFSPDIVMVTHYGANKTMTADVIQRYVWEGMAVPAPLEAMIAGAGLENPDTLGIPVPFAAGRRLAGWLGLDPKMPWAESTLRGRKIIDDVVVWSLGQIVEVTRSQGAMPIILYLDAVNDRVPEEVSHASLIKELDLPLIDLLGIFPEAQRPSLRIAPWDDHPNVEGHRIIADRLYDELSNLLDSQASFQSHPNQRVATLDDIRPAVRSFILDNFLPGEEAANLSDDMALKETGILDSMATLNLVAFLEERFGIELEAEDLDPGNLATVVAIERLVRSKLEDA